MRRRDRIVREHVRERFVVTLKTGEGVAGVLIDADDNSLILADVTVFKDDSKWSADGHVYVSRANIAYMQRPEVTSP